MEIKMTKSSIVSNSNDEKNNNEDAVTVKKFEKDDLIPCKSITNGRLLVSGTKSGVLYRWADYGDVVDVEYQDLLYLVRARKSWVFKPRFVIMDEDFINQNSTLKELYESLYSTKDLKDILKLPVNQMKQTIQALPDGAKDAIRGVASSMIEHGMLDSVQKIKILDEIFDTKLLLALEQN